jgi:hypothetical protein
MFTCVIGVKKLNFLPMGLTWVLACGNAGNVGFGIQCGKLSKIKFDSYQFRFKKFGGFKYEVQHPLVGFNHPDRTNWHP